MINPVEYYASRFFHLSKVLEEKDFMKVKNLLGEAKLTTNNSGRTKLLQKLYEYDVEFSKFYHNMRIFYETKIPLVLFPKSSHLYHVSLVQFSKNFKPSNIENYFLPWNTDLVACLQYILLWKFHSDSDNKHKIWWLNIFQTRSDLKLVHLFPHFNLLDALAKIKDIKEKNVATLDHFVCQNWDGIFRQGETAVLSIPEIALSRSTVSLKLDFVSSQSVENFFHEQELKKVKKKI